MNFNLSEEQTMIQDSVARFVQDTYAFDQRNEAVALQHGFSADNWQQFAELGWLSIPFAEDYGGFGGGPVDTMVIMQEFGRGLVAEPFLPTVLLFGGLLQAGASEELKSELIPQIVAGELQGAFAFAGAPESLCHHRCENPCPPGRRELGAQWRKDRGA